MNPGTLPFFLVVRKFNLFGLLELIPLEEIINLNVSL